jgi:alkanesulfonate monooxygenase
MDKPRFYWSLSNHRGSGIARQATSLESCCKLAIAADRGGLDGVLVTATSGGWDPWSIAAYLSAQTKSVRLLVAQYTGAVHPLLVAQQAATLAKLSGGRAEVNAVAGRSRGSAEGGGATRNAWELAQAQDYWSQWRRLLEGASVSEGPNAQNVRLRIGPTVIECPLMVAGSSERSRALAASHADAWLCNAKSYKAVTDGIFDIRTRHLQSGGVRNIKAGIRVHVLVRETESEVWAAAQRILQCLSAAEADGDPVLRANPKYYLVDDHLWGGVGRYASGPGLTVLGTPAQVQAAIERFCDLGVSLFILSGYENDEELNRFLACVYPAFASYSSVNFA